MTPANQQIVYTVVDVLALVPILVIFAYLVAGVFTGVMNATLTRPWCIIGVLAVAWLAVRGFGFLA
jgi:hypothetical protein